MTITLHADLLNTTLEDFDSHFSVVLNYIDGYMRGLPGMPTMTFSGIRTEEFVENKSNLVFPDVPWGRSGYTDYENGKRILEENMKIYEAVPEGKAGSLGFIQVVRSVRGPRITYSVDLLARVRDGKIEVDNKVSDKVYFSLFVARYRQDRVKLLMDEPDETGPCTRKFLDWLEPRWGDAVQPLPKDMPSFIPDGIRELPTEPPMAGHGGYTRDDVFDWWHRGGQRFIPLQKGLASYLGIAESGVGNLHMNYKAQYSSGRKPDNESHFAGMYIPPYTEE